jgi:hypothetical protein
VIASVATDTSVVGPPGAAVAFRFDPKIPAPPARQKSEQGLNLQAKIAGRLAALRELRRIAPCRNAI